MATETKMTKKDKFIALRDFIETCDTELQDLFLETLNHEIELLDKKASKPTKENAFTVAFRQAVVEILREADAPMRASQFLDEPALLSVCEGEGVPLRIQRVTSALTALETAHIVKREVVKKVAYFSAVDEDEQEDEDEGEG